MNKIFRIAIALLLFIGAAFTAWLSIFKGALWGLGTVALVLIGIILIFL